MSSHATGAPTLAASRSCAPLMLLVVPSDAAKMEMTAKTEVAADADVKDAAAVESAPGAAEEEKHME